MKGILITLEGIDGCGKTTQARLLRERLERLKLPHLLVREPGGTAAGEKIREILLQKEYGLAAMTELFLYLAARSELVEQVIRPALAAGKTVLCDRYIDSTVAYQGYGNGMDREWIDRLNDKATASLRPHLTFLLDLPAEEAARRRGAGGDRIEERESFYHRRVRQGYLDLAWREPQRIKVIDAALPVEEQHQLIWKRVEQLLKNKGYLRRH